MRRRLSVKAATTAPMRISGLEVVGGSREKASHLHQETPLSLYPRIRFFCFVFCSVLF